MNTTKMKKMDREAKDDILYTRVTKAKNIQLQSLADEFGLSKSTIVRCSIDEFLTRHA